MAKKTKPNPNHNHTVTGQLTDMPTRELDNPQSRRCHQKNEN